MVHMHGGEDIGDRQGMGNVGFAAAAELPVMGLFRVEVSALDPIDLIGLEVGGQSMTEGIYG